VPSSRNGGHRTPALVVVGITSDCSECIAWQSWCPAQHPRHTGQVRLRSVAWKQSISRARQEQLVACAIRRPCAFGRRCPMAWQPPTHRNSGLAFNARIKAGPRRRQKRESSGSSRRTRSNYSNTASAPLSPRTKFLPAWCPMRRGLVPTSARQLVRLVLPLHTSRDSL